MLDLDEQSSATSDEEDLIYQDNRSGLRRNRVSCERLVEPTKKKGKPVVSMVTLRYAVCSYEYIVEI